MIASLLAVGLILAGTVTAAPNPSPTAEAASQNHGAIDPCALLSASDVRSALHAAAPAPTRPAPNECLWAVASHSDAGTANAMTQLSVTIDAAQATKHGCHGLGCLSIVQSVASVIPGADRFASDVNGVAGAAGTVQEIAGLGDKARWTNGVLLVLHNAAVLKVQLTGAAPNSNLLSISEMLARTALGRF